MTVNKGLLGLIIFLQHLAFLAVAQNENFWKPVPNSPNEDGTVLFYSLMVDENDYLYIGTSNGIYKSVDSAKSWEHLNSIPFPVFHIAVSHQTIYAASTSGKIYFSANGGLDWDFRQLHDVRGITDILITDNGVFVSTGYIEVKNDVGLFRGNGLFKSSDAGETWEKQQLGVFNNHYVGHLTKDSQGRVYASVNEFSSGDGAILYSTDEGTSWQSLPDVSFDWGGENNVTTSKIVQVTSLEIDHADNISVSMLGANGRVATSVNLSNSFQGAVNQVQWNHMMLTSFGYPWYYIEGHNAYFARNGDIYISRLGSSFNLSGIFYSKARAPFEKKDIDPIMIDGSPFFNYCVFAQQSNGRMYVLQQLDNILYYTDSSLDPVLGIDDKLEAAVFPNPVIDHLYIQTARTLSSIQIEIYTVNGTTIYRESFQEQDRIDVDFGDFPAGVYLVIIRHGTRMTQHRVVK
jgi:hypothetical protein